MKKVITLLLLFTALLARAQNSDQKFTDSLLAVIHNSTSDSQKEKLYISLLHFCMNNTNGYGLQFEQTALNLAKKLNDKKGIASIKNSSGHIYWATGNFEIARKEHHEALEIYRQINDSLGIVNALCFLGQDDADDGKFESALNYFIAALPIAEKLSDQHKTSNIYFLMSWVYISMGNNPAGVQYNIKAMKLNEKIGDTYGAAIAASNLGDYYASMDNYKQALHYFFSSLAGMKDDHRNTSLTYISIGDAYVHLLKYDSALLFYKKAYNISAADADTITIGSAHKSIGMWYQLQGNYAEALTHYNSAMVEFKTMSNKRDLCYVLCVAATCYTRLNQLAEANKLLNEAKLISDELKSIRFSSEYYNQRATLDSAMGQWKSAYFNYKTFISQRDTINNDETRKKSLQLTMQYDFDKKEAATKAAQDKKDALDEKKLQLQKMVRNGFILGFAVVLVFAGIFFRQRNKIKIAKTHTESLLASEQKALEQLKLAQAALLKSEQMAAIGIVAERLSHEILNPLNFVNNFSVLSKDMIAEINESSSDDDKKEATKILADNLEKISFHGKRAEAIVKELQAMSRQGTVHQFFNEETSEAT